MKITEKIPKISVIGLGYVGLPLAIEFGKKFETIGYDINQQRIEELSKGIDNTLEVESDDFLSSKFLCFTNKIDELKKSNIFIVTVPTPINDKKEPDLSYLISASNEIAGVISKGDIVIYESTVYPGATEEVCIPCIEDKSGLKYNIDFFAGYSPERINPGDKSHRISDIKKVVSGSNDDVAAYVDSLYKSIISAGTHLAPSIKVAEAAKVIENTQRDLNIALINELSIIFRKLDIDTEEVLKAAETKWNFISFRPGLVGGHCIGVDPYYLTHKSIEAGHYPEVILAGRKINDGMGRYVVSLLANEMSKRSVDVQDSNILIMGYTFKENCPDTRNTRVVDIQDELIELGVNVDIYDPWVNKKLSIDLFVDKPKLNHYDALIIAVAHDVFKEMSTDEINSFCKSEKTVICDLKHLLDKNEASIRL
ncbi:nucleotide sugar dehydrogenase [Gammaproteobacteria bacterium]|nr:nucleotide sugar dehydrogenase [Gammaproteobacteria bacterium]